MPHDNQSRFYFRSVLPLGPLIRRSRTSCSFLGVDGYLGSDARGQGRKSCEASIEQLVSHTQSSRLREFDSAPFISVCSRISIMTGQNAARHRTTQFISPRGKNTGEFGPDAWLERAHLGELTLPSLLRKAGYRHVGKAHFAPPQHEGEDPRRSGST